MKYEKHTSILQMNNKGKRGENSFHDFQLTIIIAVFEVIPCKFTKLQFSEMRVNNEQRISNFLALSTSKDIQKLVLSLKEVMEIFHSKL